MDQLTIPQYRKVMALQQIKDEQTKAERLVSYLANITVSDVRRMTQKSFDKVGQTIAEMAPLEKAYPLEVFYKHDGVDYGFIPNLEQLTVGEMADIEYMCTDTTANLEKLMSVFYRPIKQRHGMFYSVNDYEGVNDKPFLEMEIRQALGALNFFFRLGFAWLHSTSNYFMEETGAV